MTERGFGRVYDSRDDRYFSGGVKFPSGGGWKIDQWVSFEQRVWEKNRSSKRSVSIKLKKVDFDNDEQLSSLTYVFAINGVPDHEYVYEPNKGMTSLKKLNQK